jgi:hypothetical protein
MSIKKLSFATLLVLVLASFHVAESTNSTNEETRLKREVSCPYGQVPYVDGCDGKIIFIYLKLIFNILIYN